MLLVLLFASSAYGLALAGKAGVSAAVGDAVLPKPIIILPHLCGKCGDSCTMTGGGIGVCQPSGICAVNVKAPDCGPEKCICGHKCTQYGQSGWCQKDGSCLVTAKAAPFCGPCLPIPCPVPLPCPGGQLQTPKDDNGCPLCPICKPKACPKPLCPVPLTCPTEQQVTSKDENGCPKCPTCPVLQRCWPIIDPPLPHPGPDPEPTAHLELASSDASVDATASASLALFGRCPPGYHCVNGFCRRCPMIKCAPRPAFCPAGQHVVNTMTNGCRGCPHCAPFLPPPVITVPPPVPPTP